MLDLDTTYAEEDGKIIVGRFQDCTPIMDNAKRLHNEGHHGTSEVKHAATIPNVVIERYCNDHGITYAEWAGNRDHIRAMLNDPSLKAFRIWPGAV